MNSLFAEQQAATSGYRLRKLELYNWGTFDSRHGHIHTVRPEGATTLLIGKNGTGKSTLVDAVLTLLVRPVVRNYNVAAGARKHERDEKSYIKGAYGRFSRDEDNRAEVQYLRGEGKHYSAILACFGNDEGAVFTLAQVLYLTSDGSPDKVYCLADREMSIAEHCAKLPSTDRMRQQLEKRGFQATSTYAEYYKWFQRLTGVKDKAMDMFNQTVAVKDIQSLNRFIREHMLESKPWREKIENLQTHFVQLSEAHQSLVRVRRQYELLGPIVEKGKEYGEKADELAQANQVQLASDAYFRQATIDLFEPACELKEKELGRLAKLKQEQGEALGHCRDEERRLINEIEHAGGDRLKQLPILIANVENLLQVKKDTWSRYCTDLKFLGISARVHDSESFTTTSESIRAKGTQLGIQVASLDQERVNLGVDRGNLHSQFQTDTQELESLQQRRHGNIPEELLLTRQRLCEAIRLPEKELPFAGELVAVKQEHREWQASIEMVLRSFALQLLVPAKHYPMVSAFVERQRLTDARGRGIRLHYVKVGERIDNSRSRPPLQSQSLIRKLDFKEGHTLLPWLKAELESRFDIRCCETIEEFQSERDAAVTRQRHIKWRGDRHEKDDRERTTDPRCFVLGWDNLEKRRALAEGIKALDSEIRRLDSQVDGLGRTLDQLRAQQAAVARLQQVTDFAAVDFAVHTREKEALEQEKKSLEDNNDVIQTLRKRLEAVTRQRNELETSRDRTLQSEVEIRSEVDQGQQLIRNARSQLAKYQADGSLARHAEVFDHIRSLISDEPFTTETFLLIEQKFNAAQLAMVGRLRGELKPLENALSQAMNTYLRHFPEENADLAGGVEYVSSFVQRFEHIHREDLPRHEKRFKEHMNEKVINEIGLLNASFQSDRTEIIHKIDVLNQSLRQLEYRRGTYMLLQAKDVRDQEIAEFRTSLRECLAGTFENSSESDEARYLRIEKLLQRLREDERWCEKVTDVRRWFDFVAKELNEADGQQRAYYEDSTGQSGGEKAKLAFTILVAAIAYQYDLDPSRPVPTRFRFVVVDEMFSKVDDQHAEYALELFKRFGLQLLIVAPLDSKARVTEPHVGCYLHVAKDAQTNCSEIYTMTAQEFESAVVAVPSSGVTAGERP